MKLIVPETPTTVSDMIKSLELKVSQIYNVVPVMSNKSYEEFTDSDGTVVRLTHVVFGYCEKGSINDTEFIRRLLSRLWDDVSRAWMPGSTVMWRRRPEVREESDGRIFVSARLGSFSIPRVQPQREGEPIPRSGETK